ncbi:MAG TPA: hypothetical protein VKB34_10225, partial [Povalibacter sp.]|nr:hypothetical protein [Povalibacter sp.]
TTVQRWEKREGMPVRRHQHDKRGSVYAFRSELDAWLNQRGAPPEIETEADPRSRRWPITIAVAALLAAAAVTAWLLSQSARPVEPLANARITPLTDFDGQEQAAAISRDGRFAAFLSDRDGPLDAWVTQIGSGEFRNLTHGAAPELLNPEVRSVGFTPDGTLVTLWTRVPDAAEPVNVWAVPAVGGALQPYRERAVEMDWSSDGTRMVFHTVESGDPMYLVDPGKAPQRIHVGPRGTHCHFQVWSPDDAFIYFVRGTPPDEMDIWRIRPDGTQPERITFHNTQVTYPVFLDQRTLLYLATTEDGSGPWLYQIDVERRVSQRIGFSVEQYTSLAASSDRRRLVATVEHAKVSLWQVPVTDSAADETSAAQITLPTVGGLSPRPASDYLVYVTYGSEGHGIWKLAQGHATELWSAPGMRVVGGPSIAPAGDRIAFSAEAGHGTRLYVMDVNHPGARMVAGSLEVRGSPAWSPDGRSIAVAVRGEQHPELFRVTLDGQTPARLVSGYAINPIWSADGRFLVYADAALGPGFALKAVNVDGTPHALPEMTLPRASRSFRFTPDGRSLIVVQGEMRHGNFWSIDLESGIRRQLTNFGREFTLRDFDITPDGRAIIFERRRENSDIALIERPAP